MTVAELQILVDKLQSKISQLELTSKGAIKATEFRLEAVLQANLDTFWLLICAILVFLMQAGFMCLESGLSRNKNSICLLYTSPSPRDATLSRMPSSA